MPVSTAHSTKGCAPAGLQDADWEFAEDAADDDLAQGASDEEGLDDDPGYRKELGESSAVVPLKVTHSVCPQKELHDGVQHAWHFPIFMACRLCIL